MATSPEYLELLDLMRELHVAKAAGYSGDNPDTWSNFREAEQWQAGATLLGALIRMGDKYRRAQSVFQNEAHDRVGEPLPKTLLDLSSYALISILLWEEEHGTEWRQTELTQLDLALARKAELLADTINKGYDDADAQALEVLTTGHARQHPASPSAD